MTDDMTPTEGDEQRLAEYEAELRAKYTQADRDKMAGKEAMADGSYPVADADDLAKAIKAVGRGTANSHNAIRKHIMARAKALGLSKEIPDTWQADGSLKQDNADGESVEERAKCPTCKGSGTIMDGNRDCPDCDGSGEVDSDAADDASRADARPRVTRKRRQRAVPLSTEIRRFNATDLEVRESSDGEDFILRGTPIVYSTTYDVYDAFGRFSEQIMPGAVTDVLSRGADVRMLFDHSGLPLARTASGTMSLTDTPTGLNFEARLDPRQQLANDLYLSVSRGDVSSMSIGMRVSNDSWDDAMENRTIHTIEDLLDVSAVTYPASPTTSIEIAQRMAALIPIESGARIRKLYVDNRAGKKMSASNASLVLDALHNLHDALGEAGASVDLPEASPMDPDGSIGQDGDSGNGETNADALTPEGGTVSEVEPVGSDGPGEPTYMDDGSQGALSGSEGYPGFADGSGLRSVPATKDERAAGSSSLNAAVYTALVAGRDEIPDLWIHECGDDFVVYELFDGDAEDRGLWRRSHDAAHTVEGGEVTFSDPVAVVVRSEFVPVESPTVSVVAAVGRSSRAKSLRLAHEARKRRKS